MPTQYIIPTVFGTNFISILPRGCYSDELQKYFKKEIKEVKAIEVSYKRVISTENYSNVEIGIKLTVEAGEKAQDVLEKAKEFVDRQLDLKKESYSYKVELYKKILMNPNAYQYKEVIDAQKFMKEYEEKQKQLEDEIPPF